MSRTCCGRTSAAWRGRGEFGPTVISWASPAPPMRTTPGGHCCCSTRPTGRPTPLSSFETRTDRHSGDGDWSRPEIRRTSESPSTQVRPATSGPETDGHPTCQRSAKRKAGAWATHRRRPRTGKPVLEKHGLGAPRRPWSEHGAVGVSRRGSGAIGAVVHRKPCSVTGGPAQASACTPCAGCLV